MVPQKVLWRHLRPSENLFGHHKKVKKWKFKLIFSLCPSSGRGGLKSHWFRYRMNYVLMEKIVTSTEPPIWRCYWTRLPLKLKFCKNPRKATKMVWCHTHNTYVQKSRKLDLPLLPCTQSYAFGLTHFYACVLSIYSPPS